MIPYGRQKIDQKDIDSVVAVLKSDFLTQGPMVPIFEEKVARHVGAKYGVAVNSATSALHVACLSLGLNEGDWLWTSPISFVASANCGLYCGAHVDFVDIDPKTYNMCPSALERKLQNAEKEGCLPKIVVAVHLCGQSCEMKKMYALAKEYGFYLIEDASHAIGGKYCGEFIGNCRYSDIAVFSFHPVKIITTGEGGIAVTNNADLANKMDLLRSHGVTRDPKLMTRQPDGDWYYQQIDLGFNYRMTDIQAALGISQIEKLDEFVTRRHEIANEYDNMLAGVPVVKPWQHLDSYSSFHLYVIRLQLGELKKSHGQVFDLMREQGIGVNLHYIPIHTQPYYQAMGYKPGDFPESEKYYSESLSLPIFPTMSQEQQVEVVKVLKVAVS